MADRVKLLPGHSRPQASAYAVHSPCSLPFSPDTCAYCQTQGEPASPRKPSQFVQAESGTLCHLLSPSPSKTALSPCAVTVHLPSLAVLQVGGGGQHSSNATSLSSRAASFIYRIKLQEMSASGPISKMSKLRPRIVESCTQWHVSPVLLCLLPCTSWLVLGVPQPQLRIRLLREWQAGWLDDQKLQTREKRVPESSL